MASEENEKLIGQSESVNSPTYHVVRPNKKVHHFKEEVMLSFIICFDVFITLVRTICKKHVKEGSGEHPECPWIVLFAFILLEGLFVLIGITIGVLDCYNRCCKNPLETTESINKKRIDNAA